MAENINDTPATREQVERYLRDPNDVLGKPYSTKQRIANESMRGKKWLYHEKLAARIFTGIESDSDGKSLNAPEGWYDSPAEVKANRDATSYADDESEDSAQDIEMLRKACDAAGVKYDKRWGVYRLNEALAKHK